MLTGKTYVGITVILQEQNIVIHFKVLQPRNSSDFHTHITTEEEARAYLSLRDQYFATLNADRNMAFHINKQISFWLNKRNMTYSEGGFWNTTDHSAITCGKCYRATTGYDSEYLHCIFTMCFKQSHLFQMTL